jgi:hypothetical protein
MCKRLLVLAVVPLGVVLGMPNPGYAQAREYRVALVQADNEAGGDEVPAVLRKSLGDAKDSLRFKHYRLIDTQMVLSAGAMSARLRGANNQGYEVSLHTTERTGRLYIDFRLQESGAPAAGADAMDRISKVAELERQKADLEQQLTMLRQERNTGGEPRAQNLESKIGTLNRQLAVARAVKLLDTRFDMTAGDTVLVGTAPLDAGKALLVFVTSTPGVTTAAASAVAK